MGDTDAYKQSHERTSRYTKQDWLEIKEESAELLRRFGEAFRAGVAPDSEQAMDLAEEHRLQIDRRFYRLPHEMHRGLAAMYLADERFKKNYEDVAPGLAQWVHDAIQANADRHTTA